MLALNPELVPSHTLYPCHSHGFSHYLETVTNDDTLTMDVYTHPAKKDTDKCCECTLFVLIYIVLLCENKTEHLFFFYFAIDWAAQ